MTIREDLPGVIHAEAMVETTDVSGTGPVAVKGQNDAMAALFSEGEVIFVSPDLEWTPGDQVIVHPFIHQPDAPRRCYATGADDGGRQCVLDDQPARHDTRAR